MRNAPHPFDWLRGILFIYSRRRPTLPHSYPCSTIGPEGLNFRVRDGNGCDPLGIATEKLFVTSAFGHLLRCLRRVPLNVALLRLAPHSLAALHMTQNPVSLTLSSQLHFVVLV